MLQDKPYNKDDDVIKATSFEVISTLRDVLKTSSLWRDHVQTYTQVCFVFKILGELLEAFFVPMIVTSNFYWHTSKYLDKAFGARHELGIWGLTYDFLQIIQYGT